jgi:hypothetical protein
MKMITERSRSLFKLVLVLVISLVVASCSSDDGGGEPSCDLVASTTTNPTAFFKVVNSLNGGLQWYFTNGIPFGADMKPGECTLFGLSPGGYSVTLQQCNIGSEACTSNFGPTRQEVFTVESNETYTVTVTASYFQ